ncbi:MAG: ATP-dependent DNA helicase DinG [Paenibacillaceae bacterium]|nr:ATP-dependent DNA helicase DinG [Paenibacillaceae bacterium]
MKFAVLDFETTGDQPAQEAIIHVGIVVCEGHPLRIVGSYRSFVYTEREIPPFITSLTGIDAHTLIGAPTIDAVIAHMLPMLDGAMLVGHSVAFDLGFLQHALVQCGYAPFSGLSIDTVEWLKMVFPSLLSYQLSAVAQALGIVHERPHQADSDAWVTACAWMACIRKLRVVPDVTMQRMMHMLQQDVYQSVLEEISQGTLTVDEHDLCATHVEAFGPLPQWEPLYVPKVHVHRGFALGIGEWHNTKADVQPPQQHAFEEVRAQCEEAFRTRIPNYEMRQAQTTLMERVSNALHEGHHVIVEAPTGTGKSLGYLLPAAHFAHAKNEKVIVSTHTISLQEQLREKELPLLQSVLPMGVAVLKGRSQYICLRKWEDAVETAVHTVEERLSMAQMLVWLGETKRGDREEVNMTQTGQATWNAISSDAESCLNRACPWFRSCFYHRARHEATEAHIVVTNHALLFSDAISEHRVLPAYQYLVIDEAHHLDDVGRTHLGHVVAQAPLVSRMHRLDKDHRVGQLSALRSMLVVSPEPHHARVLQHIPPVLEALHALHGAWDAWFVLWHEVVQHSAQQGTVTLRLRATQRPRQWDALMTMGAQVVGCIRETIVRLQLVLTTAATDPNAFAIESLLTNIHGSMKDIDRIGKDVHALLQQDETKYVYWIECHLQTKGKPLRVHAAPLHIGEQMQQLFWSKKRSIILTSATMAVNQQFAYMKKQLGIPEHNVESLVLPTPFRYDEQALVLIPRDVPSVHNEAAYEDALVQSLASAAMTTGGRMLVLFTSYKQLRSVHGRLRALLTAHGIWCIGQGVDTNNRSKLVRQFHQLPKAVLLGTSSFWEGVDFPGDVLTCLAIVRLPFHPPTHPVQEAMCEWYEAQAQSSFTSLSIPQAVIKFKQGFGRLVRTSTDRGVVIVYDTRIISQSYGKQFIRSLPNPRIEYVLQSEVSRRIAQWLQ